LWEYESTGTNSTNEIDWNIVTPTTGKGCDDDRQRSPADNLPGDEEGQGFTRQTGRPRLSTMSARP
jgi:hypothetical protein